MNVDPIVDEVRAIRDAIAREHHYDVDAIFTMLRGREAASGTPHVTLPPRPLTPSGAAGGAALPQP